MPRISGPDIATHVAQQQARVVRAAVDLFAERGFSEVTLSDIASAVGLKRTSVYRYFPDKDHILLAWVRTEIDDLVERSQAIAAADRPAPERLLDWLHLQFDYMADPDHQLFTAIAATMGNLGPEARAEVVDQHQRLYGTIDAIVADALGERGVPDADRDPHVVATLVLGMFRAASEAITRGGDRPTIEAELAHSALAVVTH